MSGMRIWFGPAGTELLGVNSEGTPVLADEDGASEMTEITGFIESVDLGTGSDVDECAHDWLDRPESDTRECLICGAEALGS